jgi:Dullard-like phosphatase family protein
MKENCMILEFHCSEHSFHPFSFSKEQMVSLGAAHEKKVDKVSKSKCHNKSIGGCWNNGNNFNEYEHTVASFHRVNSNCLFKPEQEKCSRRCSFIRDSICSAKCNSATISTKKSELLKTPSAIDLEVLSTEEQLKKRLADSLSPSPFRNEDQSKKEAKLDQLVALNPSTQTMKFYEGEMLGQGGYRAWKLALKDHIVHTFESICLIKKLDPVPSHIIEKKILPADTWSHSGDKKLVVFDLDETLVHCITDNIEKADKIITVMLNTGEEIKAGVNIRPHAVECLKELREYFDLMVFTASDENYANKVIDLLDPDNTIFTKRLFRSSCIRTDVNLFVKDLRILNRDLRSVIIVDNSIFSFASQLDNGIPIIPFYDDKEDRILPKIKDYLLSLKDLDDFRVINEKTFSLTQLYKLNISSFLKYYYEDETAICKKEDTGEGSSDGISRKAQADVDNHLGKLRDSFKYLTKQKP